MRNYPIDSPAAAARVLALTSIADGAVSDVELRAVLAHPAAARLGLDAALLDAVLQALCEDLQTVSRRQWGRAMEPSQLNPLLDEVRDPLLRVSVLQLALELACADGWLSEAEGRLLAHLNRRWQPESWAIAA